MRQTSQYKACKCGIRCIYAIVLDSVSEACQNWALLIRKVTLFVKKYPFLKETQYCLLKKTQLWISAFIKKNSILPTYKILNSENQLL